MQLTIISVLQSTSITFNSNLALVLQFFNALPCPFYSLSRFHVP